MLTVCHLKMYYPLALRDLVPPSNSSQEAHLGSASGRVACEVCAKASASRAAISTASSSAATWDDFVMAARVASHSRWRDSWDQNFLPKHLCTQKGIEFACVPRILKPINEHPNNIVCITDNFSVMHG